MHEVPLYAALVEKWQTGEEHAQTARKGADRMHTVPSTHPTQMAAPWHSTW